MHYSAFGLETGRQMKCPDGKTGMWQVFSVRWKRGTFGQANFIVGYQKTKAGG
jgi:hypothetical protein